MPSVDPTTYPITMPEGNIARIELGTESAQQVSESPRSFARHVIDWGGERWRAQVTIQRGDYTQTAPWRAFLTKMRGSEGSFYLNPYGEGGAAQLGKWNDTPGRTIRVKTGQVIDSHRITLTTSVRLDEAFKAGDFIQLGSGSNARLHMILDDIAITGNDTTINVWPKPRANLSMGSTTDRVVTVVNPHGVFYFRDPQASWVQDNLWNHEVSFTAYSL